MFTYFFISHDLSVVEAVNRVAVMYFGSIVEVGTAKEIFSKPKHPYTKLLADSAVIGKPLTLNEKSGYELPDILNPPNVLLVRGVFLQRSSALRKHLFFMNLKMVQLFLATIQ